ncbi:MAG: hypothetical protein RIQ99_2039 [Pseudomonadota bacterium]
MKTEYPIMALLGIELFLRLGLLLPYIGKQGRDLIAITTIYRPIALTVFIVHTCVTMALVDYPYPPMPGLLVMWGLAFFGLEIRKSRGARTNTRAILGALSGITAFFVIGRLVAPTWVDVIRPVTHDAALVPFLFWLSWEALQAWRGSRNVHYLVAGVTMFCAIIALIAFTHIYARYSDISFAQIGYHVEAIIWLRFLGTGLLSLTLLALNNVYSQRLWRAAVAKRRAKEVSLIAALGEIARVRDNETGKHLVRVRLFVRTLARNLARRQQRSHGFPTASCSSPGGSTPVNSKSCGPMPALARKSCAPHSMRNKATAAKYWYSAPKSPRATTKTGMAAAILPGYPARQFRNPHGSWRWRMSTTR